jgi:8-oxo-dGTP pyrophosphatase MutT (NUDIX family)
LTAAIREVEEETGVKVGQHDIKLKAIAIHHHVDLKETWLIPIFLTTIPKDQSVSEENSEGKAKWIEKEELLKMDNIFPPAKFYFDHVLNDKPGIMYTNIYWGNSQLLEVKSQRIDRDY